MAAAAPGGSSAAQKQWEAANDVKTTTDDWYHVDKAMGDRLYKEKPWKKDNKYFKEVHMSMIAAIKILMHAKTGKGKGKYFDADKGNWVEVMGLMQGHVKEHAFVVTDSFAIPVEASEVEAVMGDDAAAYMFEYVKHCEALAKPDAGAIGWYHSHPGLYCFLSGTDVPTQQTNQAYQDPWLAIVVDPVLTMAQGKMEIHAYRTYPEGYTEDFGGDMEGVPLSKIEEYGAHANKYSLDLLWNRYWMQTLSVSPLVTNRHFIDGRLNQLLSKYDKAEQAASHGGGGSSGFMRRGGDKGAEKSKDAMAVLARGVGANTNEVLQGVLSIVMKDRVFNVK
jgi:COP9 signalosome complex subunit 5